MTKSSERTRSEDHRTRVGAMRRERMRLRLVESALVVFSERGVEASIDEVIANADVSRGSFYNHFRTNTELLGALSEALGNELIEMIEAVVGRIEDPVERVGAGLLLFLRTAQRHPRFAGFFWRAGFHASSAGNRVYAYLPEHIAEGIKRGALKASSPATAVHVLMGVVLSATFALSTQKVAKDYPQQMVRHAMLALGVSPREADRIVALPLPELEVAPDSLLGRTQRARRG